MRSDRGRPRRRSITGVPRDGESRSDAIDESTASRDRRDDRILRARDAGDLVVHGIGQLRGVPSASRVRRQRISGATSSATDRTATSRFLRYLLCVAASRRDLAISSVRRANRRVVRRLRCARRSGVAISLPTSDEQRAIADFLDAETARIDALIAKKRRMIELLDERRRRSSCSTRAVDLERRRPAAASSSRRSRTRPTARRSSRVDRLRPTTAYRWCVVQRSVDRSSSEDGLDPSRRSTNVRRRDRACSAGDLSIARDVGDSSTAQRRSGWRSRDCVAARSCTGHVLRARLDDRRAMPAFLRLLLRRAARARVSVELRIADSTREPINGSDDRRSSSSLPMPRRRAASDRRRSLDRRCSASRSAATSCSSARSSSCASTARR